MADPPKQTDPSVEPKAEPTPQPPPTAAQPSPATGAAPTTPPKGPELDPNQLVVIDDGKGGSVFKTIQEMADASIRDANAPAIDADQVENFGLFTKAFQEQDQAAAAELVQKMLPKQEAPAKEPGDRIAQLEKQVVDLSQQMSRSSAVTNQIEELRSVQAVAATIENYKDQIPYCAKLQDQNQSAATMIHQEMRSIQQALEATNGEVNLNDNNVRLRVLAEAIKRVEGNLKATATAFGAEIQPGVKAGPQDKTVMVDDQAASGPGHLPAGVAFVNGRLVDHLGRPVQQTGHRTFQTIPSTVPEGVPSGASAGPDAGAPQEGPMTRAQMDEKLRQRIREMNGSTGAV